MPLRLNPHYAKLKQLIAPDNQISSMDDLVGSPFVNNKPTTLNLQLNSMKNVRVLQNGDWIYEIQNNGTNLGFWGNFKTYLV